MKKIKSSTIEFVLGASLLAVLPGCVGYVDEPGGPVYAQVPAVQDDYVYYPEYQVYYSSNRRQYVYQEGNGWVTRPAPAGVSVDVLSASRSVKLGFHDHPSLHHAAIVQQYPKHVESAAHAGKEGGNERN